jgi:hypothetical protein
VTRRTFWWKAHDGTNQLTSWPGSKKREKEGAELLPQFPSKTHSNVQKTFYQVPPPEVSTTFQSHHNGD